MKESLVEYSEKKKYLSKGHLEPTLCEVRHYFALTAQPLGPFNYKKYIIEAE